jgi:hypothetical protein
MHLIACHAVGRPEGCNDPLLCTLNNNLKSKIKKNEYTTIKNSIKIENYFKNIDLIAF